MVHTYGTGSPGCHGDGVGVALHGGVLLPAVLGAVLRGPVLLLLHPAVSAASLSPEQRGHADCGSLGQVSDICFSVLHNIPHY